MKNQNKPVWSQNEAIKRKMLTAVHEKSEIVWARAMK